jgi:hypothetical protein
VACNAIVNSLHSNNDTNHTTLNAIIAGASIYYNYTGKTSCLNLDSGDDIGADMWDYQVHSFPVLMEPLVAIINLKNTQF